MAEALAVAATLPARSRIRRRVRQRRADYRGARERRPSRGRSRQFGRMLDCFRANLAGTPVVRSDARQCPFGDGAFDAAFSWGMLLHLQCVDQAAAFASVSRVLKPGAQFLFTAAEIDDADDAGISGTMNGVTFPYYAIPSYRTMIAEYGLVLVKVHDDPGVSTSYLARKSP